MLHPYLIGISQHSQSTLSARRLQNLGRIYRRAPRPIDRHYNGYKASEWEAWLKYYGVPLLDQRLGEYVRNFRNLGEIFALATQHSISQPELLAIENLAIEFEKIRGAILLPGGKAPSCLLRQHPLSPPPCVKYPRPRTWEILVAVRHGALLRCHKSNGSLQISIKRKLDEWSDCCGASSSHEVYSKSFHGNPAYAFLSAATRPLRFNAVSSFAKGPP